MQVRPEFKNFVYCSLWLAAVVWLFGQMMGYESQPAPAAVVAQSWPDQTAAQRISGKYSLVVFIHPHCPCSRATLDTISRLITHHEKVLSTTLFFVLPDDVSRDWAKTDLYQRAQELVSAGVKIDSAAIEANRFGGTTSGQALLYSPNGSLVFSGGLTDARGKFGESASEWQINSLLLGDKAQGKNLNVYLDKNLATSMAKNLPVYGCALTNGDRAEPEAVGKALR
jgi:hypothetical protein